VVVVITIPWRFGCIRPAIRRYCRWCERSRRRVGSAGNRGAGAPAPLRTCGASAVEMVAGVSGGAGGRWGGAGRRWGPGEALRGLGAGGAGRAVARTPPPAHRQWQPLAASAAVPGGSAKRARQAHARPARSPSMAAAAPHSAHLPRRSRRRGRLTKSAAARCSCRPTATIPVRR
jgi:hypothetical protein